MSDQIKNKFKFYVDDKIYILVMIIPNPKYFNSVSTIRREKLLISTSKYKSDMKY